MEQKISSLVAASKPWTPLASPTPPIFLPASLGGQQFALIHAAVTSTATLGAAQVSGTEQTHSAVLGKVAGRFHLHDDMIGITNAAHSLVLLGTAGLGRKISHAPQQRRPGPAQFRPRLCRRCRRLLRAHFISLGLAANFITNLNADITDFEAAITAKGTGAGRAGRRHRRIGRRRAQSRRGAARPQNHRARTPTKTIRPNSPNGPPPATWKNTRPCRAPNRRPPRHRRNKSKRRRRGIFVVIRFVKITSSVGAAYSDVAPDGA